MASCNVLTPTKCAPSSSELHKDCLASPSSAVSIQSTVNGNNIGIHAQQGDKLLDFSSTVS